LGKFLFIFLLSAFLSNAAQAASCERSVLRETAPFGEIIPPSNQSLFRTGGAREPLIKVGQAQRLVVWNAHKAEASEFWRDFSTIGSKADIFLMQETLYNLNFSRAMAALSGRAWTTAISFTSSSFGPTGVSTGSSAEPKSECYIRSEIREPLIRTPKVALISRFSISDGRTLLVLNFHGINFVTLNSYEAHLRQIEKSLIYHQGPIIMAGDFNTYAPGRNLILFDFMRRLNLKLEPLGNDTRLLRLDHILTRGIHVNWAWVVNWMQSSDHYPIVAEFQL
jgi:endonuclease/exonuclease/phosphatase (EEP) superfamily protein YafD